MTSGSRTPDTRTSGTRVGAIPQSERVSEMTSRLPSKLFFRIGEVASLVGVEPHVLRYWEREFRSIRPTKSAKGQRVYSRKDVENLLRVRDLLYRDGFTIAGAKKRLQRGAVATDATASLETREHLEQGAPGDARENESENESENENDLENDLENENEELEETSEPEERDEEVALTQPESGPRSHSAARRDASDRVDPTIRRKLTALRAEVESFLVDLETA